MTSYTDLLLKTKSEQHGAFTWEPATDNEHSPVAGLLTITGKRCHCRYRVEEYPADMPGRAFVLVKVDAGSDKSEGHYSCFIGTHGNHICECKGFQRYGACKHCQTLQELISAGQI
jgi:hypothetical protein